VPSEAKPFQKKLRWYYRGPDVPGTTLYIHENSPPPMVLEYFVSLSVNDQYDHGLPFTLPSATVKIARHQPVTGPPPGGRPISTPQDLAFDPEKPPPRIETLATYQVPAMEGVTVVPPAVAEFMRRVNPVGPVTLNMFAGPQLLSIEIISPWSIGISTKFKVQAQLIHELHINDGVWNLRIRG
jgi:hypothetical protein